ncbi:hypothetical protein [Amycolatopsis magusensis]|uniref:hypothetical protein n=1 Tax=Amycolatopsis magusensis TaxID=882444 RepID=UPI0024A9A839|nr:hypothetical protein [Amycolatopsis magusensis]MDI5980104.1 hypothetical protein [Amycolatopsis magusensis]
MPTNEHGVDTSKIRPGSVVRCLQSGDPCAGGGRVRTVQIDRRHGGRLTAHTVDTLHPQGCTDLLHIDDITAIQS